MSSGTPDAESVKYSLETLADFTNEHGSDYRIRLSLAISVAKGFDPTVPQSMIAGAFTTIAKFIDKHGHSAFSNFAQAVDEVDLYFNGQDTISVALNTRALFTDEDD